MRKKIISPGALLTIGLIITVIATILIYNNIKNNAKHEFVFSCNEISNKIYSRLNTHAQILRSGAAFFNASDTVTRKKWQTFVDQAKFNKTLPGMQGMGFSLVIPKKELQRHIQLIRKEGFPEYTVKPQGNREIYTSNIFIEPFAGRNLRAFGFDMFSEPVRREAMERARDFDIPGLSGKVTLLQETYKNIQAGALMYLPVFRKGVPVNTIEQRRKAIIGWVYSPYRMNDLMSGILGNRDSIKNHLLGFIIYDGTLLNPKAELYRYNAQDHESSFNTHLIVQIPINFNNHYWTLLFSQPKGNLLNKEYSPLWLIFFGGIIISFLMFLLLRSLKRTNNNAKVIADKLTSKLRESEEEFRQLFEAKSDAIFLIDIKTGSILKANNSAASMYGYTHSELLSKLTSDILAENQPLLINKSDTSLANNQLIFAPLQYHRKKDGTVFPVEISGRILIDREKKRGIFAIRNITQRKQDETILLESKKRFEILLNSTAEAIYGLDMDGNCTFSNNACLQILGYEHYEQLLGLNMHALIHHSRSDGSPFPIEECEVFKTFRNGKGTHVDNEVFWRKDGSSFSVEYWSYPIIINGKIEGSVVTFFDITERKKIEEALRLKTNELENFFNVALDLLCIADTSGNFIKVNKAWENILGYPVNELENKPFLEFVHPDDLQETLNKLKLLSEQNPILDYTNRYRCKDGSYRHIEWKSFTVKNLIYAAARDITERKNIEQHIQQQNIELQNVIATKDRFFSILAHDLRSPFASILAFSEILIEKADKLELGKIKEFAGIINKIADETHKLLENLLDWSRIQQGLLNPDIKIYNLHTLSSDIHSMLNNIASNKKIMLLNNVPPNIFASCDSEMTKTLMRNLVSNAIKFTAPLGTISIEAEETSSSVVIKVIDTGVGIPANKIPNLFRTDKNVSTRGTANEKGSGLGLILCKDLIEKQSGEIWVESEVGKGSVFYFSLPKIGI